MTNKNAIKILVIGPAWIGDMVMAQSFFKLLKQRQPNAIIDVLAPAWTASILRCMPEVTGNLSRCHSLMASLN